MPSKPVYIEVRPDCPDPEALKPAVDALRRGGLVVYPTDTLYGLGADPRNREAVESVFRVKERPADKPLPILIAESHYALDYVEVDEIFWRLARKFWPGPLTIVAPPAPAAPSWLRGREGVGVRLPGSQLARFLAASLGGSIIGTSANRSGLEPPRTAQEAMFMLGSLVDVYIDGGPTPVGKPSTVVQIVDGRVRLLREGAIPARLVFAAVEID